MSHKREGNPLLVRKISRNSKHARNLIPISISVEPFCVSSAPDSFASEQAEVCSTLIPIPWGRSCGLFHALGTCVFGCMLFLMLPATGAAKWILLSPACTADNKRNGRWEEKCVGCRLLRFLPSDLPFTCSSPTYHARVVYVTINSDVNNLAIFTELLKQTAHAFTIL